MAQAAEQGRGRVLVAQRPTAELDGALELVGPGHVGHQRAQVPRPQRPTQSPPAADLPAAGGVRAHRPFDEAAPPAGASVLAHLGDQVDPSQTQDRQVAVDRIELVQSARSGRSMGMALGSVATAPWARWAPPASAGADQASRPRDVEAVRPPRGHLGQETEDVRHLSHAEASLGPGPLRPRGRRATGGGEAGVEVGEDVVDRLEAHRQADQARVPRRCSAAPPR